MRGVWSCVTSDTLWGCSLVWSIQTSRLIPSQNQPKPAKFDTSEHANCISPRDAPRPTHPFQAFHAPASAGPRRARKAPRRAAEETAIVSETISTIILLSSLLGLVMM